MAVAACSASPEPTRRGDGTTGTGGTGVTPGGTGGSMVVVVPPGKVDPNDKRDVMPRKKVCDASGLNCTCLRLALLGTLDSAAVNKDTQPFVTWLNDKSGGTATVTMVSTKPTLNADFLAQYDILLVANVNGWSFGADEKAAVEKWVRETAGGIISLTGFVSTDSEVPATNQLIEFSGVKYAAPQTAPATGEAVPVYYKGGSVNLKECLFWNGDANGAAKITTPLKFTPQSPGAGNLDKLTLGLDYVGAFYGWSVTAPAGATVLAKDPAGGSNMAVAYEVGGKGRIYAFGDEWVIFANQWVPKGTAPGNSQMDANNICWHPADANGAGFYYSVQNIYQTKQFWFNAISWAAPPNECSFVIDDPDVTVPR